MKKRHDTLIIIFFFVLPYIFALALVAASFNALVLHSMSFWRILFGSAVGAIILFFLKLVIDKPITNMAKDPHSKLVIFISKNLISLNLKRRFVINIVLDFFLCMGSIYLLQITFTKAQIMGSMIGWLLAALFASVCLGASIYFDDYHKEVTL